MKIKICCILLFFLAVFTYGQVTLVSAVEDKEYRVNQKITVTFVLQIDGNELFQETPLRLPDFSRFNIIGTASDQNSYVDSQKKIVINQMIYQYAISPKEAGKIKIGSALVDVNGKTYKTEPFDIIVKDADKKAEVADNNTKDFYLNLELKNKQIYENQPVVAVLKVYSKDYDNFRRIKNINLPAQSNISIKLVSSAKSEIETNEKNSWSSQVVAIFMIIPNVAGRIDIDPVSVSLKRNSENSKNISSNSVKMNVMSLPKNQPSNYKNAVGSFNMSIQNMADHSVLEVDKPINVILKVSGKGNLETLHLPKILPSKDYVCYKPEIISNVNPNKKDFEGQIVAHYVIVPKHAGKIKILTEDFSYFNPEEKKYVDLGSKFLNVNILTPEQVAKTKSTLEKVNEYTNNVLEKVDTPVLQTSIFKIKDNKTIDWRIVLVNLVLIFGLLYAALLYRRYRILRKRNIQKNISRPIVTVSETEDEIRKKLNPDFEVHLAYIKNRYEQRDFSSFFNSVGELQNELEVMAQEKGFKDFRNFVETEKGVALAGSLRLLQQKMQIEKYAPLHSEENVESLNDEVQRVFSEIIK